MTDKELVINVLKEHSCLTAQEIRGFIFRSSGDLISNQSISAILRPVIAAGLATKGISPHNNKTVYWLTKEGEVAFQ